MPIKIVIEDKGMINNGKWNIDSYNFELKFQNFLISNLSLISYFYDSF
jgi:hypothetical protein